MYRLNVSTNRNSDLKRCFQPLKLTATIISSTSPGTITCCWMLGNASTIKTVRLGFNCSKICASNAFIWKSPSQAEKQRYVFLFFSPLSRTNFCVPLIPHKFPNICIISTYFVSVLRRKFTLWWGKCTSSVKKLSSVSAFTLTNHCINQCFPLCV